jgi:hypothetical protein
MVIQLLCLLLMVVDATARDKAIRVCITIVSARSVYGLAVDSYMRNIVDSART